MGLCKKCNDEVGLWGSVNLSWMHCHHGESGLTAEEYVRSKGVGIGCWFCNPYKPETMRWQGAKFCPECGRRLG